MNSLEDLPTDLAICGLSPSGEKIFPEWVMNKPTADKSHMHPNVPIAKSPLWVCLKEMHTRNMPDTWCRERVAPLAKALQAAMKKEDTAEGIPRSILEEHGMLAWHAVRRLWDLHLAYSSEKSIGGIEKIVPMGDAFGRALKNASFRLFYITMFKDQLGRALFKWKEQDEERRSQSKCRFSTEMAGKNYRDMIIRVAREHRMIDFLKEAASEDSKLTFMGSAVGDYNLTTARCEMVAQFFYKGKNPGKEVDEEACSKNAQVIFGVAARMVDSWADISPTGQPTVEVVAREICVLMLRGVGADERMVEREYLVNNGDLSSSTRSLCIIDG